MRRIVYSFTVGVVLAVAAFLAQPSQAQPFTLDEKIKPTELKLADYKAESETGQGRLAQISITQTDPSQYFFVEGVSIYSPDYVGITADDPSLGMKVSLHKETWEQAAISGHTDGEGHWETKFKTTGDFGIQVVPDKLPAKYSIIVWVGKEVDPQLPSPFVYSSSTGGVWLSSKTIIISIVGLVIVAIVAVLLFRSRSKAVTACLVFGLGLCLLLPMPTSLGAQDMSDLKNLTKALDYLKKFLELEKNNKKMWDDSNPLSPGEAAPDMDRRGPTMPSSCAGERQSSEECRCFAAAAERLNKNRLMLEKMRIMVANQKAFKDKAIALGNSYAQLHTLMGLQWIGIRTHDIEEPYAQFKTIANQKHQLLMAAIQDSLKTISACEAKMGERDWYEKYGFVYYEFLYDAYKPSF